MFDTQGATVTTVNCTTCCPSTYMVETEEKEQLVLLLLSATAVRNLLFWLRLAASYDVNVQGIDELLKATRYHVLVGYRAAFLAEHKQTLTRQLHFFFSNFETSHPEVLDYQVPNTYIHTQIHTCRVLYARYCRSLVHTGRVFIDDINISEAYTLMQKPPKKRELRKGITARQIGQIIVYY